LVVAIMVAAGIGCSSSSEGFTPAPAPEQEVVAAQPRGPEGAAPSEAPAAPESSAQPTPAEDGGAPKRDGGAQCKDTPDPGGNEATAYALAPIDDCDGSQATVRGISAGVADVDMYKFSGSDTSLCRIVPKASITGPGLRLCEFIKCQAGTTAVTSCGTAAVATSKTGLQGCCLDGPGEMNISFNCAGSWSDSADFYLQVEQPKTDACVPYSVTYSL
jgi:hypothetical protein